jgi:hypothetical protein
MNEQYHATFWPKASPLARPAVAWPIVESAYLSGTHPRARRARCRGHRALGGRGGVTVRGNSVTSVWW